MLIIRDLAPSFKIGAGAYVPDAANDAIRAISNPPDGGCPSCLIEAGTLWPASNPNSRTCERHAAAMVARSDAIKARGMGVQHA